jgi:hypothetical protein
MDCNDRQAAAIHRFTPTTNEVARKYVHLNRKIEHRHRRNFLPGPLKSTPLFVA